MYKGQHITVVIPALDEEASIGRVLDGLSGLQACADCSKPHDYESKTEPAIDSRPQPSVDVNTNNLKTAAADACSCTTYTAVVDQMIVCDNGSSDNTASIARKCGAIVTEEPERGYGAACLAALAVPVEKDIVVFADGDHSVVAEELPSLLDPLFEGADMVIGSRTLGVTEKGALSTPQAFGNHLASLMIRVLWRSKVTDLGPFRAITQSALQDLNMSDRKFGWTVEMQVVALQQGKRVVEVPVTTRARIGKSKISGTVRGVIGAAHGILGTIGKLYFRGLVISAGLRPSGKTEKPNGNA